MAKKLGKLEIDQHPCERGDELYQTIVDVVKKSTGDECAQGRVIVLFEKKKKKKKTGKKK